LSALLFDGKKPTAIHLSVSDLSADGWIIVSSGDCGGKVYRLMVSADGFLVEDSERRFIKMGDWSASNKANGFCASNSVYALSGEGLSKANSHFNPHFGPLPGFCPVARP
jgi:hypothetical protein